MPKPKKSTNWCSGASFGGLPSIASPTMPPTTRPPKMMAMPTSHAAHQGVGRTASSAHRTSGDVLMFMPTSCWAHFCPGAQAR